MNLELISFSIKGTASTLLFSTVLYLTQYTAYQETSADASLATLTEWTRPSHIGHVLCMNLKPYSIL